MKKSFLAFFFVSLALLGAGCFKSKSEQQSVLPQASPAVTNDTKVKATEAPKAADPKAELLAAFEHFKQAKSYKVKYTMPTPQGTLTGTLAYAMPNRFQGTMELSPETKTDVVLVENSLYMRSNNAAWVDISSSPTAKQTIETMKLAVSGDQGISSSNTDSWSVDSKNEDAQRGCWDYSVRIKTANNPDRIVSICVKDGYPKYLKLDSAKGEMDIEYLEYNTVFIIERPM